MVAPTEMLWALFGGVDPAAGVTCAAANRGSVSSAKIVNENRNRRVTEASSRPSAVRMPGHRLLTGCNGRGSLLFHER